MMVAVEAMFKHAETVAEGKMLNPLDCLDTMQLLGFYSILAMTTHHESIKDNGGDVEKNRRRAEDAVLSSMAGLYVSFAGTFNQTATRDQLIAAVDRQAIVFQQHCDEFVAKTLNNLDN